MEEDATFNLPKYLLAVVLLPIELEFFVKARLHRLLILVVEMWD